MKLLIHLVSGETIPSRDSEKVTEAEVEELKNLLKEVLGAAEERGSQISMETDAGWVCFPGRSIRYVSLEN